MTRKHDFIIFKVHLIHRKQVPLLHNTIRDFFFEGDALVSVSMTQSNRLTLHVLLSISVYLLRYRGSYMSAHVLLNLLNELGKKDKMRGLSSILSLFRNEFYKIQ